MAYSYEHPHPAVTTDIVIFTIRREELEVLLVRRGGEPYKGYWALPGGFVDIDEDLEACALRELEEETGVTGVYLEQLYTFGAPDRDPRERVISVTYYAMVPADRISLQAASDADEVGWFEVDRLPPLAFDHESIIAMAHKRLASKLNYSTIALQFMPERFTLRELQQVYESILGETLDKRNFRKRVIAMDCLKDTGERRRNGNHRPARLYAVKSPGTVEFIK
ncbi:MAG TPA: NUDIX domain-containing protein [Gammaproteobacteria bacterium]|nr:NUDIX domain-containing protein [Gammaproteobacteria bacterium]